jgi:predicted transcriptional regulator
VNPLPDRRPGQQRAAVRTDARLDAATRQNVDDLATRVDRPRAAVLCQIMAWGLSRAQPAHLDQGESPGPVRHLYLYVASDLHAHVEKAAAAAGVKAAPWLRHMVRQITITDVPASWQAATPRERSHDSRTYTTRFMLRLDEPSQTKLEQLIRQLGVSKADIIRQLIAQAKPEDFPPSWQLRTTERRAQQPRR